MQTQITVLLAMHQKVQLENLDGEFQVDKFIVI